MKIHLLTVADTQCENIGTGCGVDVDRVYQFFAFAAEVLGVTLNASTVRGDLFRRDIVERELEALHPGQDDVVVFYYSGHGFRTDAKQERWPYLAFQESEFDPVKGLAADAIFKNLQAKRPRLLMVLSDCCNSYLADYSVDVTTSTRSESAAERARVNLNRLLVKARGTIIATSSEPGEYAIGTSIGGLFTMALLEAAESHIWQRQGATWEGIFRDGAVVHAVPQNESGVQTPVYRIDLGGTVRSWTLQGRGRPKTRRHSDGGLARTVGRTERSTVMPWIWLVLALAGIVAAGTAFDYPGYAIDIAACTLVVFSGTRGYRLGLLEGLGHTARWLLPWLVAFWVYLPLTARLRAWAGWNQDSLPLVVFGTVVLVVFSLISFILRRVADGHASTGFDAVLGFVFSGLLGFAVSVLLVGIAHHFDVAIPESSHFLDAVYPFFASG